MAEQYTRKKWSGPAFDTLIDWVVEVWLAVAKVIPQDGRWYVLPPLSAAVTELMADDILLDPSVREVGVVVSQRLPSGVQDTSDPVWIARYVGPEIRGADEFFAAAVDLNHDQ